MATGAPPGVVRLPAAAGAEKTAPLPSQPMVRNPFPLEPIPNPTGIRSRIHARIWVSQTILATVGVAAQTIEEESEAPGMKISYWLMLGRAVKAVVDRFRGLIRLAVPIPGDSSSKAASVDASTAVGAPSMCRKSAHAAALSRPWCSAHPRHDPLWARNPSSPPS